jgi:hypothetical protein
MTDAGRELDTRIAALMGDRLIKRGKWRGYWDCGKGRHYSDEDGGPLHYSTDIAAAWLVVEQMHADGFEMSVNTMQGWIEKCECIVSKGVLLSTSANAPHRAACYLSRRAESRRYTMSDQSSFLDVAPAPPPTSPAARRHAIRYGVAYCLTCNLAVAYCGCARSLSAAPGGMTLADAATQRIVARRDGR